MANTPQQDPGASIELPVSQPLKVARLPARKPTRFELQPDAETCRQIAAVLDLSGLRKLRFQGSLRPSGRNDWLLEAELGATVVQPCVVSLAPVTTRIDEKVIRRYLAQMPEPEADEAEIPEDETIEELGEVIDPGAVMIEALALALPLYPRAEGVELGEAVFAEPGANPMRDEDARPFAGLAALRNRLKD